ncbi:hypothetical protein MNBD_GAMMA02-21 [hydrothermal vent metagenome]|uniref:Alginate export domain-containing protein n=1 Tax=hydrothermal vent metagenome TaxID=652676 RepID=A0A3B0VYR6_9ZZZZ
MLVCTGAIAQEKTNKEDSDLVFLPPTIDNNTREIVGNDLSVGGKKHYRFKFILDNTTQRDFLKDQSELVFHLPDQNTSDWNNLTRIGLRGELAISSRLALKTNILLNAHIFQNKDINVSDDLRLDIRETYFSWQYSPTLFVDAGRINIKNGVASGFNPTDYFKVGTVLDQNTEDASQLRNDRLGTLALRGQTLWDGGAITFLVSPKVGDKASHWFRGEDIVGLNLQKSNDRTRFMLKFTHKVSEGFSPEYIYYNESGKHNFGLNISKTLNKQWLGYGEWSVGERRNLIDEALLTARYANNLHPTIVAIFSKDEGKKYQHQFAIGASYTTVSNVTTNIEYHYNEAGLSKTDENIWFQAIDDVGQHAEGLGQLLSIRGLARARGESFGKHTLFIRSSWTDAIIDGLDLTGLLIIDINDNSNLIQAEAVYDLNSKTSLTIRLAGFQGDKKSNYGSLSNNQTMTLKFKYNF